MNTTKPCPPFIITCAFHAPQVSLMESTAGVPLNDDDMVFLDVKTPVNSWHVHVKRATVQAFFDALNTQLPTPIEFENTQLGDALLVT